MMATTHVFAGLAVAAAVAVVAPQFAAVVAAAAILGGLFPDFDLYAGHRKTLHFPVYYWALAVPAGLAAVLVPTDATVGLAVFLLAAGLHSASDRYGGGLELRPWEATSQRAVYSHYHGRWFAPRRWIRYDGAPEDLLLAGALAVPALVVFEGPIRTVALALLGVSIGYAIVRKPLVAVAQRLLEVTPDHVVARIPERLVPVEDDPDPAAD